MSQELSEFMPYRLFRAAEVTSRSFQKVYKDRYGMLRTEWRVLFHLGNSGSQTAKQIGERASLHKTKVSRAVKALEIKRYLKREPVENDRRSEVLSLTKSGQIVLSDLTKIAADYDRQLADALGKDQHQSLTQALDSLIALY
ncbi:MarR family winged helix-turn-helix transcriptional regulator [Gammaproteobacteria bacterium]|nr:MarR family winged helix-turn-helix transcriptional regulator [Gammaproteobacteria bacterium]